jgi:hypothetical protein
MKETKKPSPLAHLGPSAIERRYKASTETITQDEAKTRLAAAIERCGVEVGVSESLKPKPKAERARKPKQPPKPKPADPPVEKKRGRPSTTGKPWEKEGISRAAYYKRQKAKDKP